MAEELKVLQKTYDMIQYGYISLRQYPKSEKHTLAAETKRAMFKLLEAIIMANKRYYNRKLRKRTALKMKRRLKYLQRAYARGEVGFDEVNASVQSYVGLLKHCNSYNLRRKLFDALVFVRQ